MDQSYEFFLALHLYSLYASGFLMLFYLIQYPLLPCSALGTISPKTTLNLNNIFCSKRFLHTMHILIGICFFKIISFFYIF